MVKKRLLIEKTSSISKTSKLVTETGKFIAVVEDEYAELFSVTPELLALLWEYRIDHEAKKPSSATDGCVCALCEKSTELIIETMPAVKTLPGLSIKKPVKLQ